MIISLRLRFNPAFSLELLNDEGWAVMDMTRFHIGNAWRILLTQSPGTRRIPLLLSPRGRRVLAFWRSHQRPRPGRDVGTRVVRTPNRFS